MDIKGKIETKKFKTIEDIDCGKCFHFLDSETLYMRISDYGFVDMYCGELYESLDYECKPVEPIDTELRIIEKKNPSKSEFHSIEKMNSLYSILILETIRYALDLDIDDLVIVKLTENGEIVIRTEKEKE